DPGLLDNTLANPTTVSVDWGDGVSLATITQVSPGSYTFTATHHYSSTGSKSISVTVTDKDSGANPASTTTASVTIGAAATACLDASPHRRVITGPRGNDRVHINAPIGSVRVQAAFLSGGQFDFPAGSVSNVVILLGAGDDVLTVAGNITL